MIVQQLRIGNIVSFANEDGFLVIDSINGSAINEIHSLEDIKPVDLNLDTLSRISFCHINSKDSFEITTTRRFVAKRYNNVCFEIFYENLGVGVVCSLHSLQNLIYAITGAEIEVDITSPH